MAKDLPYFKFFVSEWNDGDITLEDYKIQGLFINVCAYYWSRECNLDYTTLLKKFKHNVNDINIIIESDLIKLDGDTIYINFLDEQCNERGKLSKQNSLNAKKRWKKCDRNANASIPQSENHAIKKREEKKREEYSINSLDKEVETLNALKKHLKLSDTKFNNYLNEFKIPFLKDTYNQIEFKDKLTHFINFVKKQEKVDLPEVGRNGQRLNQAPRPLGS